MQIKKEKLRNKILEIAKEDFFSKGYRETSMRNIAKKANISLSNIYTYFKNKDELLQEIAEPLISAIYYMMENHNSQKNISTQVFKSKTTQEESLQHIMNIVENHKQELHLLLSNSEGSIYANFKEELIEFYTKYSKEYLEKMREKYPNLNTNISDFFIHCYSSSFVTIISEMVSHDMPHEKLETYIREYIDFNTRAWKGLMKVKTEVEI